MVLVILKLIQIGQTILNHAEGFMNFILKEKLYMVILVQQKLSKQNLSFIENQGYSENYFYNADATEINWESLLRNSLISQQETPAPGFKISKE